MPEISLLDRLRTVALRNRWLLGLAIGSRCRVMRTALVGLEGTGLACRAQVFAGHAIALSPEIQRRFAYLHSPRMQRAGEMAILSAQLAEAAAILLDDFAARVAPVWDRVLAVAVHELGVRGAATSGLKGWLSLCDTARLADLSGLNVIDGFAARDLAQEGHGAPLSPIPYWMLLHDSQKTRVLVEVGKPIRLTYLPASRDTTGAGRVRSLKFRATVGDTQVAGSLAAAIAARVITDLPPLPRIEEFVLCRRASDDACSSADLATELATRLPGVRLLDISTLGIDSQALWPAAVALLGQLHLDQTPANLPAITGARTSRVLGRLTPGSLPAWHRLVRELSSARPSVMTLRSAV